MRQVDVARNFIFAIVYGSDEQNCGHAAIAEMSLTFSKLFQELVAFNGTTLVRKCFHLSRAFVFLCILVSLLFLLKLFAR